jgi:PrcB C-terminal
MFTLQPLLTLQEISKGTVCFYTDKGLFKHPGNQLALYQPKLSMLEGRYWLGHLANLIDPGLTVDNVNDPDTPSTKIAHGLPSAWVVSSPLTTAFCGVVASSEPLWENVHWNKKRTKHEKCGTGDYIRFWQLSAIGGSGFVAMGVFATTSKTELPARPTQQALWEMGVRAVRRDLLQQGALVKRFWIDKGSGATPSIALWSTGNGLGETFVTVCGTTDADEARVYTGDPSATSTTPPANRLLPAEEIQQLGRVWKSFPSKPPKGENPIEPSGMARNGDWLYIASDNGIVGRLQMQSGGVQVDTPQLMTARSFSGKDRTKDHDFESVVILPHKPGFIYLGVEGRGEAPLMGFTTIAHAALSSQDSQLQKVINTQAEYDAFYAGAFAGQPPSTKPSVDFTNEVVLVVAMGEQATTGYSIAITEIRRDARQGKTYVGVVETVPPKGDPVVDLKTQPLHVVKLSRNEHDEKTKYLWGKPAVHVDPAIVEYRIDGDDASWDMVLPRTWPLDLDIGATDGMEALTFVPDGFHPFSTGPAPRSRVGVFLVVTQHEPHVIHAFDLNQPLGPDGRLHQIGRLDFTTGSQAFNGLPPLGRAKVSDMYCEYDDGPVPTWCYLYLLFDDDNSDNIPGDQLLVKCEYNPSFEPTWTVVQQMKPAPCRGVEGFAVSGSYMYFGVDQSSAQAVRNGSDEGSFDNYVLRYRREGM